MFDLKTPNESYKRHINQVNIQIQELGVGRNTGHKNSKTLKEHDRLTDLQKKLVDEQKRQTDHVALVSARIKEEKDKWFPSSKEYIIFT